jgi:hypothetical protein
MSMVEIEPSNLFSTCRREASAESTRPVGPWPTSMRARRVPSAFARITWFEPMPLIQAEPSALNTTPRGSPIDCARSSALTLVRL